jgi:hypothetical protein
LPGPHINRESARARARARESARKRERIGLQ